jgi:hypothetical protein
MPSPDVPRQKIADETGAVTSPWLLFFQFYAKLFGGAPGNCIVRWGTGSPQGVLAAPVGSVWLRTDGAAGSVLYIKEVGNGSVGWAAK